MKKLLLFLALPVLLPAAHPPAWLTLPAPGEKAPEAATAWVLYDSVRAAQDEDGSVHEVYRKAVMPLTDYGVRTLVAGGIVFAPGDQELVSARGWAMSPDGRKCRAFGGDEFVVSSTEVSDQIWDLTKTAFIPAERFLQPGWIFAWEIEIKSKDALFDRVWSPAGNLPVRQARLEIVPAATGEIAWRASGAGLPPPEAGAQAGALVWDLRNLPARPATVPDSFEAKPWEIRAYLFKDRAHNRTPRTWSELVSLVRSEMDPKERSTPDLAGEALRLAGHGDLWEKVRPLCQYVQKRITYLLLSTDRDAKAGFRPHAAGDVLQSCYGDCKDKAVLLCTMLKVVGVDAKVLLVNSGAHNAVDKDWPSVGFNHAIVAINAVEPAPADWPVLRAAGTDYVLFDPTDESVPLGFLPVGDAGGYGLVLADGVTEPSLIPWPDAGRNAYAAKLECALAADGSGELNVHEEARGLNAFEYIESDETRSKASRTSSFEGRIQRTSPLISQLTWDSHDELAAGRWSRQSQFVAGRMGQLMPGHLMYVRTDKLSRLPLLEPWTEEADGAVARVPEVSEREFRLTLPAGWTAAELPGEWSAKNAAGDGNVHFQIDGDAVVGKIHLRINGGMLDRAAYADLRELVRGALAAERAPVVLRRVAPPPAPAPAKTAT
jgi:transglutaminase-like putative cysteine protease